MVQISAASVKELREKTGAGFMDCKRALSEVSGNLESAIDWLRKKGLSAAENKANRIATEGLIGICLKNKKAGVIEVNAETDFVARNADFQEFVLTVGECVTKYNGNIDKAFLSPFPNKNNTLSEELTQRIATIGENLTLRRCEVCSVEKGIIASYIHGAVTANLGKIGVLVVLESKGDEKELYELGKQLAMHIAATRPKWLSIDDIEPEIIERERKILIEQAGSSKRPSHAIEKMVEGRIRKFYEEFVLLEQIFVIDNKTKIRKVLESAEKELGTIIQVSHFVRYALGEGLEKKSIGFAEEVAATLVN